MFLVIIFDLQSFTVIPHQVLEWDLGDLASWQQRKSAALWKPWWHGGAVNKHCSIQETRAEERGGGGVCWESMWCTVLDAIVAWKPSTLHQVWRIWAHDNHHQVWDDDFLEQDRTLLIVFHRAKKFLRSSALKIIDFAMNNSPEGCARFVEALGMKTLFSAFMKSGKKKKERKGFNPAEDDGV